MIDDDRIREALRDAFQAGYRVAMEDVRYSEILERRIGAAIRKFCRTCERGNLAAHDRYTYHCDTDIILEAKE